MFDKMVSDDNYTNTILLNIAKSGESFGGRTKKFISKNWKITSTIITLAIAVPFYFIWGMRKGKVQ